VRSFRLLGLAAAGLAVALAVGALAALPPDLYFEADQHFYLEMARSQPFSGVVETFRQWLRLPPAPRWRVPRFLAALSYGLGDFARVLGWP